MERFDSMPNFRSVTVNNDENTKERHVLKLFRSSRPDILTADEVEQFKSLGIRSIIDCRSPTEYRKATGPKLIDDSYPIFKVKLPFSLHYKPGQSVRYTKWKQNGVLSNSDIPQRKHFLIDFFKINYIWTVFNRVPWYIKLYSLLFLLYDVIMMTGYKHFVRVFAKYTLNEKGLIGQYTDMLTYSQAAICSALKLLSDPENVPAMLNCAHGKDRTGLVTAMVLSCFGTSKEDIAYDYARSENELEPIASLIYEEIVTRFHMCTSFTKAKSETMMKALQHIDEKYGGVTNYLECIGFNSADQQRLRQNLATQ